jgi:RHS repeat-associated protein
LGQPIDLINPGSRAPSSGYQARRQSWTVRDGFGNPRWDFSGNGSYVSRLYDAKGHVTEEDQSQVVSNQSADGERFADVATTAWWNSLLMPVGKALSAGAIHKYTYDAKGQLSTTSSRDMFLPDTSYVNHTYAYSRSGQLVLETTHFAGADIVRRYQYNRRGQRISAVDTSFSSPTITDEKAGRIDYYYDSTTARLDSMVGKVVVSGTGNPYGKVTYTYDRGGREITRAVRPGSTSAATTTTTTSYDAVGRVAGIATGSHYSFGSAVYNKVGDLQSFTSSEPGVTSGSHNYTYATDGTRRLLSSVEGGLQYTYTYDFQGNRLTEHPHQTIGGSSVCENIITAAFDADNRLLRRIPGAMTSNCLKTRYWTDQAGNRLGEADTTASNPTNPPIVGLQSVMSYTAAGKLYFSINMAGDPFHNSYDWHWYDAEGRRVMSQIADRNLSVIYPHPDSVGGYRTYYIYDGSDVALQLVRSGSTWTVDQRFLTGGLDRQLIGRFSLGGAYKNESLIADRNGSTVKALDSTGATETNAAYFPRNSFGALANVTGTGGVPLGGVGYAGAGTPNARGGFVYMRNRWYDPQTGQFLTQDPIGLAGGVNLYAYAGNNPIAFSDPFGLCKRDSDPTCNFLQQFVDAANEKISSTIQAIATTTAEVIASLSPSSDAITLFSGKDATGETVGTGGRVAAAGFLILGVAGEAGGALHLVDGMRMPVDGALDAATKYLGEGYKDLGKGRFLSADGLRQVRMGVGDILAHHGGGPHINFERLAPNPAKAGKNMLVENIHVYLDGR